jgi:hypothetical protein
MMNPDLLGYDFTEKYLLKLIGTGMLFDLVEGGLQAELVIEAAKMAASTRKIVRLGQFDGMEYLIRPDHKDSIYSFTCKLSPDVLELMWRSNLEPSKASWDFILPVNTQNPNGINLLSHEYIGKGQVKITQHCSEEARLFLNKLLATTNDLEIKNINKIKIK